MGASLVDALGWLAFGWLLVVAVAWRRASGPSRASFLLSGVVLMATSAPRAVDLWLIGLERDAPSVAALVAVAEGRDAEASLPDRCAGDLPIVILGGGVDRVETDPSRIESLSRWAVPRLVAGARLAAERPSARVIVTGGRLGEVAEADVMATYLTRLGVPATRVEREDRARSTRENATFVRALLGADAPRIALVTLAVHMRRAEASFRAVGVEVCAVPVGSLASPARVSSRAARPLVGLWPSVESLELFDYWLHERIGWWWYRVRGWIV